MLTGRQQEIWDYLVDYVDRHGYPPTVREIGERVGSPRRRRCTRTWRTSSGRATCGATRRSRARSSSSGCAAGRGAGAPREAATQRLPLLGEIAAGGPLLAEQQRRGVRRAARALVGGGADFLLRVKGDSMIDAGILEGDLVVVRRQTTATNGDIVVALAGEDETADEATVKRYFRENGRIRLQPENDALEPIYARHVQILGKVVGVFRAL